MEIKVRTDDVLTVTEAARELKRARLTIYRWIGAHKIIGLRFGDVLYIPKSEVERIKNKQATGVEPAA